MDVVFNKTVAHGRKIYKAGSVAEFSEATALDLINKKIARPFDHDLMARPAAAPDKKKVISNSTPSSLSEAAQVSPPSKSTRSRRGGSNSKTKGKRQPKKEA